MGRWHCDGRLNAWWTTVLLKQMVRISSCIPSIVINSTIVIVFGRLERFLGHCIVREVTRCHPWLYLIRSILRQIRKSAHIWLIICLMQDFIDGWSCYSAVVQGPLWWQVYLESWSFTKACDLRWCQWIVALLDIWFDHMLRAGAFYLKLASWSWLLMLDWRRINYLFSLLKFLASFYSHHRQIRVF